MAVNITSVKISSDGAWQGNNPLNYAFPLLIVQTTLVLAISRSLGFFLKPFRQPKVIAEIVGGIILGPSALGRNKDFLHWIFPSWSTPILESVASVGLLFFLFLVGLELDLSSIRRSGRRAFSIALAGMSIPFIFGIGLTFILRKAIDGADKVGYSQFIVFMGVSLSITAFPVLARILAELKLLTTQVGETAMAAAAFNDMAAWIMLALAVALAGNNSEGGPKSPLISIWVLLSGVAFVIFMFVIVRPGMTWVARQCSPGYDFLDEAYVCLTLAGVMLCGFMTDLIGIHAIFGAFVFGLMIPGGDFAARLIKRIEDFVMGLLLPLYFASSGLKTNIAKIHGAEAWGLLAMVITTSCAGKILGTFVVAMLFTIPARESLALGVLMNTKGLVELIVLNIGKEKKVLNDEMFAILVLMALFTTFLTTPTVMAIYKPARGIPTRLPRRSQRDLLCTGNPKDEVRIMACVHGPSNVPSLINLIESTRTPNCSLLKLYAVHLVELTDRSSSILTVHRARRNGFPFINRLHRGESEDRVAAAFEAYAQLTGVTVRAMTAISSLCSMHEDIYHVAKEKGVTTIILPFHKQWRSGPADGDSEELEFVGHKWREVNQRVLDSAPCHLALFVDRREALQEEGSTATVAKKICVLFLGGPDDRDALELGWGMADSPGVRVTVTRLVRAVETESRRLKKLPPPVTTCTENDNACSDASPDFEMEKELDKAMLMEFRKKRDGIAQYIEKVTENLVEEVLAIGRSGEFDLILVGRTQLPPITTAELTEDHQVEHPELGPIGDVLASSGRGIVSSMLVVQHYDEGNDDDSITLKKKKKKKRVEGEGDVGVMTVDSSSV